MTYRNKTYVCFDGDNDIHYYWLMKAWKQNDGISFNFFDAHDLNTARDTSLSDTIKRKLRERLLNSKVLVVLIGAKTRYLYRFVRWEMEQALKLGLPIVAVNLNGLRRMDPLRCPPVIRAELAIHVSYGAAILEHTLDDWQTAHYALQKQGVSGPHYYRQSIYSALER